MPQTPPSKLTVAVVGATGAVGRTMVQVLLEKRFPFTELRLLASERSAGRTVDVAGETHTIGLACPEAFDGVAIALLSAGGGTSKELAPEAAKRGAARASVTVVSRLTHVRPRSSRPERSASSLAQAASKANANSVTQRGVTPRRNERGRLPSASGARRHGSAAIRLGPFVSLITRTPTSSPRRGQPG